MNNRMIVKMAARSGSHLDKEKPSVKTCLHKRCPDLLEIRQPLSLGGGLKRLCGIANRIPGNLAKCPKEEDQRTKSN